MRVHLNPSHRRHHFSRLSLDATKRGTFRDAGRDPARPRLTVDEIVEGTENIWLVFVEFVANGGEFKDDRHPRAEQDTDPTAVVGCELQESGSRRQNL